MVCFLEKKKVDTAGHARSLCYHVVQPNFTPTTPGRYNNPRERFQQENPSIISCVPNKKISVAWLSDNNTKIDKNLSNKNKYSYNQEAARAGSHFSFSSLWHASRRPSSRLRSQSARARSTSARTMAHFKLTTFTPRDAIFTHQERGSLKSASE